MGTSGVQVDVVYTLGREKANPPETACVSGGFTASSLTSSGLIGADGRGAQQAKVHSAHDGAGQQSFTGLPVQGHSASMLGSQ